MLKLLRRSIAAIIAGASAQPISRAAVISESAVVMTDAEAALKEVEYEHDVVGVRPEYLKNYAGPRTVLSDEMMDIIWRSKRFRNGCITAKQETEEFVAARMRD